MKISHPTGRDLTPKEIQHLNRLKALIKQATLDGVVSAEERQNIIHAIFEDHKVTPEELQLYRELIEDKVKAGDLDIGW